MKNMSRRGLLLVLCALSIASTTLAGGGFTEGKALFSSARPSVTSGPIPAPPLVAFAPTQVQISRATPGGEVLIFGVGTVHSRYYTTTAVRQDIQVAGASDGLVQITLPDDIPGESVWVALDMTSGRSSLAVPAAYTAVLLPVAAKQLHEAGVSAWDRFDIKAQEIEILWSRPGVGAWRAHVADGGPLDADGAPDGHIGVLASALTAIGSSGAAPVTFLAGDSLYVINDSTLEVSAIEVGQ